MKDFLSNEVANITFTFGDGHEPEIPIQGSVVYTVLDHSGNPITDLQNVELVTGPGTFQSTITIPAEYNTVEIGKVFERRTIFLRYSYLGQSKYQRISYRILPFMAFTTTPAVVRTFLGVNKGELPDEDIDLFSAYMFVREAFPNPANFNAALTSGDRTELVANEAIAMRAAIDLIPSLQNRVAQSEKNGVMGFDRIKIKDFSELLAEAYRRYDDALLLIGGPVNAGDYTLILVTQDTDPVTAGT